jgi:hypothetical protein
METEAKTELTQRYNGLIFVEGESDVSVLKAFCWPSRTEQGRFAGGEDSRRHHWANGEMESSGWP